MKKISFPTQALLLKTARIALTARTGFEKKAGQCKRFQRQIGRAAGVPLSVNPPVGLDAAQTAQWYRDVNPELIVTSGLPGDWYFYEGGKHGPHGHMAMREFGNIAIENSTAHAPEDEEDGRGVRRLDQLGTPSLIVRVWK